MFEIASLSSGKHINKKAMYPALIYETGWLRLRRIFEVISLGKAQCCLAKFCYSDPLSRGRGYPFRTVPGSSSYHLESPYPASIGYLVEAREVPRKKEGERAPGTSGSSRGGSDAYPATSNNHRTACINCQLLPALVKHLISFLPVPAVAATASPTRPFFRSRPRSTNPSTSPQPL
ncbi:hypothetical protein ACOSQ2_003172 [Xanthoceras sorbifolium]